MRCRDFSGDDGGGCGGGDGDGGEARGKEMPKLIERIGEMGPPPFLTKTFEIVNDPNTHSILSLCGRRSTFIVRDPHRLSTDLLPKHSDHNNFSSSVRQLNTCDHNSRMLIGADEQRGGLYYFRGLTASKAMKTIKKDTMDLWHLRLGYPSERIIKLLSVVDCNSDIGTKECDICFQAKQCREPTKKQSDLILELEDLIGRPSPSCPASIA
ncbi:uncharacterized protein [Primulina huaijiensis]|uniref:uncharacterized protein isoform X1 n=1 Tax=Primulina huaijiensis TaxID=1492673 RepID=UPI003CC736C2